MKRALQTGLVVLALGGFTCGDSGPHDPPPRPHDPATNAAGPVVVVPDLIGVDLAKAVDVLEEAGLASDLSALSKTIRGYASGYQTHPRVRVTKIEPDPGTEVEPGQSVAILEAECPPQKSGVC